jgi:uncharacterized protein (DUF849 family)
MGLLPQPAIVCVGGIGRHQAAAGALGAVAADGVRIGLEDNLWVDWPARTPATNPGLVTRMSGIAAAIGRPLATVAEVRSALGLRDQGA